MNVFFDLSLDELQAYRPPRDEPADFNAFWQATLTEVRQYPLGLRITPVKSRLQTIDAFDVTFNGFAGQPIKGWLLLPRHRQAPLPCVVQYIGYGGGRGIPIDWLVWSSAGYAHFVMDTRGQGSDWRQGDTPDPEPEGTSPQFPGFMTRGILSPQTYYYRRVYADAVRAVEAARQHADVDPNRIIVMGRSQGGGICLAVAGLEPGITAVLADVPYLCHFRRAVGLSAGSGYGEIVSFCRAHRDQVQTVFATLAYFDGVNFAARARAPGLFSAGLMDDISPPSTVFAAYNHYAAEKAIEVWQYNGHEGGDSDQLMAQLAFLEQHL